MAHVHISQDDAVVGPLKIVIDVVAAKKALIECMGLLGRLYGEVEA